MDYEQEYYDLLFKYRKLNNEIELLKNELDFIKGNNIKALTITFVKKITDLNKIIDTLYIYNLKESKNKNSNIKKIAINNLKLMEGEKK